MLTGPAVADAVSASISVSQGETAIITAVKGRAKKIKAPGWQVGACVDRRGATVTCLTTYYLWHPSNIACNVKETYYANGPIVIKATSRVKCRYVSEILSIGAGEANIDEFENGIDNQLGTTHTIRGCMNHGPGQVNCLVTSLFPDGNTCVKGQAAYFISPGVVDVEDAPPALKCY